MESKTTIESIWESNDSDFIVQDAVGDEPSEVDGKVILAKVVGPAFFPETTSGNNVFYPREAWENALGKDDLKHRLSNRLMYGTIGHKQALDDDAIREGKASHIVTKVWIDEDGQGKAEYLVLNTPAGKNLNTYLRAKSRLRVSTRAGGLFESHTPGSTRRIIPHTFELESIDFVTDPGYREALPQVIESTTLDNPLPIKESNMSENNDKVVAILESRITELKQDNTASASVVESLRSDVAKVTQLNAINQTILESYQAIGTPTAIQEVYAELAQYRLIGTPQELHEAFDAGEATINKLTANLKKITEELEADAIADPEEPEEYKELGSPEDIKAALEQALELTDEVAEYRELGTPQEISQALDASSELATNLESDQTTELADKYGVGAEVIQTLLDKGFSLTEAGEFLGQVKGDAPPVTEEDLPPTDEPPADEPPVEEDEPPADKPWEAMNRSSQGLRKGINGRRKNTPIVESRSIDGSQSLAARLMSRR